MKQVAADTSALISLSLSGELKLAVQNIEFYTCQKVKQELEEMAEFKDHYGTASRTCLAMIKENKIKLETIKDAKKAGQLVDKNIDLGEAECLILAIEKNINTILMDDINASYPLNGLAKSKGISLKISAAAIIELVNTKKIEKSKAIKAIRKMVENRKWEKSILNHLIEKYLEKL